MLGIKLGKKEEVEKIFGSGLRSAFGAYELPSALIQGVLPLLEEASRRGTVFTVHAPHPFNSGCNIASLDDGVRAQSVEAALEAADMASRIRAWALVLHSGIARERKAEAMEAVRASLREVAGYAGKTGVRVTLENDSAVPGVEGLTDDERFSIGTLCAAPEDIAGVLHGLDIGLTFDVGHAFGSARYLRRDPYLFMARVITCAQLRCVHVTDISGAADFHTAVGSGEIDFARAFGLLNGFRGPVILENYPEDVYVSVRRLAPLLRTMNTRGVPSEEDLEMFCAVLGWGLPNG